MTYIEINGTRYPATVNGRMNDYDWNNRESKTITLEMTYTEAVSRFVDGLVWSIIQEQERTSVDPDTGEGVTETTSETYDNSEYCIAGSITDNRDGTVSVKMGKQTEVETLQSKFANVLTEEELTNAYLEGVNSL